MDDYKKKYEESVERALEQLEAAKTLDSTEKQKINDLIYSIFPWIRDERIKEDIKYVLANSNLSKVSTTFSEMLQWLDRDIGSPTSSEPIAKKCEMFDMPEISAKDSVEVASRMEHIDEDLKPIAEFILDYALWDLRKDEWNQPTMVVPVFRALDALILKGKPYSSR